MRETPPLRRRAPRSPGRAGRAWLALCKIVEREEPCCRYCGKLLRKDVPVGHPDKRCVDHIIPLEQGGPPLDRGNLAAACWPCNTDKGNRTPAQWRADQAKGSGPVIYTSAPRVRP